MNGPYANELDFLRLSERGQRASLLFTEVLITNMTSPEILTENIAIF
jgi:hypothetical protein